MTAAPRPESPNILIVDDQPSVRHFVGRVVKGAGYTTVSASDGPDPRVMALFQAICAFTHLPRGFRDRDLRAQVEALWGRPYSAAQMTYDLRRLRLKGLLHCIPKTHRYTATSYGLKVAFFYAKLYLCIFRPNWPALAAKDDPFPSPLRAALDGLDREIQKLHEEVALAA